MVTIAHAAALSKEDVVPFEHGLALARASGGKLCSVHAKTGDEGDQQLLDPADVLSRWGDGAPVSFEPIMHECCDDPVDTVLDALGKLSPDLVIAATHQREGIVRALVGSAAEAIAHNVSVPTLLLPIGHDGFVSRDSGAIDLRRIVVPIGDTAAANAGIDAAAKLVAMAGATDVELVLLHVGAPGEMPTVEVPGNVGWKLRTINVQGEKLEDAIISRAADACVVVMATRGHDSLGDVLLGSHTDRVLHRATCPVLSVPV